VGSFQEKSAVLGSWANIGDTAPYVALAITGAPALIGGIQGAYSAAGVLLMDPTVKLGAIGLAATINFASGSNLIVDIGDEAGAELEGGVGAVYGEVAGHFVGNAGTAGTVLGGMNDLLSGPSSEPNH